MKNKLAIAPATALAPVVPVAAAQEGFTDADRQTIKELFAEVLWANGDGASIALRSRRINEAEYEWMQKNGEYLRGLQARMDKAMNTVNALSHTYGKRMNQGMITS